MSPTEDRESRRSGRRRLCLKVEYDGTDFAGFQLQGKGERTVQAELEAVIRRLSGQACRIHGAGRTDAGVHALGQVVQFDTDWTIPAEKVAVALNYGGLPDDIAARGGWEAAADDFHVRYSATARIYRYTILNRPEPSALLRRYALHMRDRLDVDAMAAAGRELTGAHDFAAFGTANGKSDSTIRRVERIDVRRWKDCVLITVRGNAFLRQMVRSFVGALVLAGQRKLTPEDIRRIRDSRDRAQCPPVAPAQGLCLARVEYGGKRHDRYEEAKDTDHENVLGPTG